MSATPEIQIYEPALCCSTGVCGPELDQSLVTFTADVAHLDAAGGRIRRHNLASDPNAFVAAENVREFLEITGSEGLPLATVDGHTVLTGRYPTRAELLRWAGLAGGPEAPAAQQGFALALTAVHDGTPDGSGADQACSPSEGCC